jgi:hypothetical protein
MQNGPGGNLSKSGSSVTGQPDAANIPTVIVSGPMSAPHEQRLLLKIDVPLNMFVASPTFTGLQPDRSWLNWTASWNMDVVVREASIFHDEISSLKASAPKNMYLVSNELETFQFRRPVP